MRFRTIAAGLALLALARPAPLHAQITSTNYALRLYGGAGASDSSGHYLLTVAGPNDGLVGRGSSATNDVVPGLVGQQFSPVAKPTYLTGAKAYAMVATPVTMSSKSPGTYFAGLGAYNNTSWRIGHYDPLTSGYREPGTGASLDSVMPGQGYWLITSVAHSVSASGLPVPNADFTVQLTGPTGSYQQLGNPYLFPIKIAQISVSDGAHTFALTASGDTLTEQKVSTWNGAGYANPTVVAGLAGFWLKKLAIAPLTLTIPLAAATDTVPAGPVPAKPDGADWAVVITPREDARVGGSLVVGAAAVPAGQRNNLSVSRAPEPLGGTALGLYVPVADWGASSGDYTNVFEPSAARMSWEFVASGGEAPGELAFDVAGFDLPDGMRLYLTDLASGSTRAVAPGQTVTAMATASPHHFRLDAVQAGAGGPATTLIVDGLRAAYPNPFRAGVGLAFGLARGGDLAVEIFDVAGRRVRTLESRGLAAGEHVLVWDGHDGEGRALPNGVYLARYRAGSRTGVQRLVRLQ